MENHSDHQPDFGTDEKKLSIYLIGLAICSTLTLLSFWVVMKGGYAKSATVAIIYVSALLQFFTQLTCFLRLSVKTESGQMNVMAFVFTGVVLVSILVGSLWIMANLDYFMRMS